MAQAIERSVKTSVWSFDQPTLCHRCAENLVDVFTHSAIRQSKYGQIYTLFQQLLITHVIEVFCPLMDAFEVIYGSATANDIPPARLPCHAHFQILKILFFKQRDVLLVSVKCLSPMAHTRVSRLAV